MTFVCVYAHRVVPSAVSENMTLGAWLLNKMKLKHQVGTREIGLMDESESPRRC